MNEDELFNFTIWDVLNETTLYKQRNPLLYIAIYPDNSYNFDYDPYFKVSWEPITRTSRNIARIGMKDGNYRYHYGMSVDLPKKIVDVLNDVLPNQISGKYKLSIWKSILKEVSELSEIFTYDDLVNMYPCIEIKPTFDKKYQKIKWGK